MPSGVAWGVASGFSRTFTIRLKADSSVTIQHVRSAKRRGQRELYEKRGRDFGHDQRMSHQTRAEERDDAGDGAKQPPIRLRGFAASADKSLERQTNRAGEERRVEKDQDASVVTCRKLLCAFWAVGPRKLWVKVR
jgi:hypothetical protein